MAHRCRDYARIGYKNVYTRHGTAFAESIHIHAPLMPLRGSLAVGTLVRVLVQAMFPTSPIK